MSSLSEFSILGDNWRAIILPFSSPRYLYSSVRLSNLVDLSFEYLWSSNKRKKTMLFPSPLRFLQWTMINEVMSLYEVITYEAEGRIAYYLIAIKMV